MGQGHFLELSPPPRLVLRTPVWPYFEPGELQGAPSSLKTPSWVVASTLLSWARRWESGWSAGCCS